MQIQCKNLTVGYEDGPVAEKINFEIEEGDYVYVVGDNGSGKTTLLKTLAGLIKPLDGLLTYENTTKEAGVGYLPQHTQIQKDFPASVAEIVLSGRVRKTGGGPFYNAEDKKTAQEKMKKLGIENLASKAYRNLSGGQQQRVLLARALCAAESILLLDEPVSGLDPAAASEMYDCIRQLNDDGMTLIMISHDVDSALEYADKILEFRGNRTRFVSKELYRSARGNMK